MDHLAATCLANNPDITCSVESWLCNDVSDNVLAQLFCG